MSGGPTRVASRALARALSRPLHTSGANDKAAHALNLAPAAALPPAAPSASALPWFARFIGAMLDVALTPAQRAAMLDRNANDGRGFAASGVAEDSDALAAVAAARRERDVALDRVADLESTTASLRASVTKLEGKTWSDSDQMSALREQLWRANQDAADARVALNAVREDLKHAARREADLAVRVVAVKDEAVADVVARAKTEFDQLRTSMEEKHASLLASVECKVAKLEATEAKARGLEAALAAAETRLAEKSAESQTVASHELYGTMLRDFGYKKIYAMAAANLVSKDKVGIYDQQRAFREERAQVIAREKAKEAVFSLPGVVTLAEGTAAVRGKKTKKKSSLLFGASTNTGAHILDGQHRVGALEILLSQGVIAPDHDVLVEVFENVDDARASEIFTEINAAQPVRFVDMPGVAPPDVKWMLEGAAQRIKERYPAMFSTSERCKIPNVNLDVLREELFSAEVVNRFGIADEDAFVTWLEGENAKLAQRTEKEWLEARPKRGRGSTGSEETYLKALAKAKEHGFYLGMDFSWLDVTDA